MNKSTHPIWKKKLAATVIAATLCMGIGLGPTGIASASEITSSPTNMSDVNTVISQQNIDKLAENIKMVFTHYITFQNGQFVVNEKAIRADGYGSHLKDFRTTARAFNTVSQFQRQASNSYRASLINWGSFASCLVYGALGIPAGSFAAGTWTAIVTAVKAWNWGLVASTVARALGPAFLEGAGKYLGGPLVIAATLAGAAAVCAFQS